MKELDILLERFIEDETQPLVDGSWPEFEALLQTEDDVLWDWVQDSSGAEAAPYRNLLEQMRSEQN